MSLVTIPRIGIPVLNGSQLSAEWYRFFHDINERVGGVNGWSVDDLRNAPESAGKAETAALAQDVGDLRLAADLGELRAQLSELLKSDIDCQLSGLREQLAELLKTDIEGQLAQLREQVAYGMAGLKRKRVVAGSIVMNSAASGTFTISPAVSSLDLCDLRFLGFTSTTSGSADLQTAIELTNTTTITARRVSSSGTVTAYFQLTEYTQ
jgi:hypothetical protein